MPSKHRLRQLRQYERTYQVPMLTRSPNISENIDIYDQFQSPACVIEVFETQRSSTESERIAQKSQTDRQSLEPAIRRESSEHLADAGQQGLYWLIWAVVLAGLALRIFGS